jgi:glycosyltransferase involved in cell wall biosynthesis
MHRAGLNMPDDRTVLHVLPHPGGGGETYVDALAGIEGYRTDRIFLADRPKAAGAQLSIARRALRRQWARAYDVLHVEGEVAATLCLGGLLTRPSVVTLNGLHLVRRLQGLAHAVARANLRMIVHSATRTICVSDAEYAHLRALIGSSALRRVAVVHNGVPLQPAISEDDRGAARADLGIRPSAMVAVWAGALEEHKDPLTPVRAVAELAHGGGEVTLLVAGDGSMRPQVERAAQGSDEVRVLGFRHDLRRLFAASDVFVLSSNREGLSFALLEAMSFGLVPIVSDEPSNVEAVHGAGVVVPFGDGAALARALSELAHDASRRDALAAQARKRVRDAFSAAAMLDQTCRVYDEIIGGRTQRRGFRETIGSLRDDSTG